MTFKPLPLAKSYRITFTPDGNRLVVVGQRVAVWNLQTRKRQGSYRPFAHPSHVDMAPSGRHCVVKSTSGELCVMTLDHPPTMTRLPHRLGEGAEALFTAGEDALVDGGWGGGFVVWDIATGEMRHGWKVEGAMITTIVCDGPRERFFYHRQPMHDGRSTPVPTEALVLRRWPFADHPEERLLVHDWDHGATPAFSPDGRLLGVAGRSYLLVLDVETGEERVSRALDPSVSCSHALAWSPDGTQIACIEGHQVSFFDAATLARRARHVLDFASDVAFSPDGRLVALGAWSNGVVMAVDDLEPWSEAGDVARMHFDNGDPDVAAS